MVVGGKGKKSLNSGANGRLNDILELSLPFESTAYKASLCDNYKTLLHETH